MRLLTSPTKLLLTSMAMISALVVHSMPAQAATLVLDSFTNAQARSQAIVGSAVPNVAQNITGSVFPSGTDRQFELQVTVNDDAANFRALLNSSPGNGTLSLSNDDTVESVATVTYGTCTGSCTFGPSFASTDLTDSGVNNGLAFSVISSDATVAAPIELILNVNGVTFSRLVTTSDPQLVIFFFSDFAGVNFSNVTSLNFRIDTQGSPARDITLDVLFAGQVPEPFTTAGLVLAGAFGIYTKRRSTKLQQKAE